MTPIDVLFLANVLEKVANREEKMGSKGALNFIAMELRTGVKEFQEGDTKHLTFEVVKNGGIRGEKKV